MFSLNESPILFFNHLSYTKFNVNYKPLVNNELYLSEGQGCTGKQKHNGSQKFVITIDHLLNRT